VYAGAVMVLYVFVVAYVGGDRQALAAPVGPGLKTVSALFAGALLVELCIAMLGSGLSVLDTEGTGYFAGFGTPQEIGRLLLTDFLLAFELASILLLVAAVGAVVLARRRSGLEVAGDLSVADVLRGTHGTRTPAELETQAEAAGPAHR
jgi:NADH-quinone oxidoreductase subunit J